MPDDIKWPQKVTRYRIQCPFQRLLIAKHESQIDWSGHRIESSEALDSYLRQVMLPGLKDCITPDHPKSHYCKSIHLERMLANPAPHINEARQIRQRDGDEAARQFLLGHINQHKKEHFEGWWRYLMEENPLYAQHPAFQYLVLRPVLESSTAKDTRTPLPVDAEALAHLFDRMNKGRVAPGTKLLSVLSEIMAFGAKAAGDGKRPSFGTECRWVVVKQQDANAANRVAALSQGSGWCVASSSMAESYLRSSDFHLLVEGGRAKVALRLSRNQAVEVQGHGNRDPGPWWPRILLYCAARGTQITHRHDATHSHSQAQSIRQELIAAQRTTRRLGELLRAQPAKVHLVAMPEELDDASRLVVQEAWLACVRADPLCGGLLPGWMEADPAVKQATLEAWIALVRSDSQSYAAVPGALAQEPRILAALRVGWMELLRRDVTRWNQCPEFLQKDEEVIQALKIGWVDLLNRDVAKWNQCPEFLQLEFRQDGGFIQTFKMGWMELLNRDVTNWTTCPEFLQKDKEVIRVIKTKWTNLLKRDVSRWNQCPEFLQQEFRQDGGFFQTVRTGWVDLLNRDVAKWNQCPEFLQNEFRQDAGFIQTFRTGWIELLKCNVTQWNQCPDFLRQELKKDGRFMKAFMIRWVWVLKINTKTWNKCPDDLHKPVWMEWLNQNPEKWAACPETLKQDQDVIDSWRSGWISWLRQQDPERQKIWMAILLKRNVLTPAHENAFWMTVNEGGDYLHPTQISTAAAANQQLPPLPSDPLPAYAAASFKVLLQEPRAMLPIVQGWKHSPRLELARCAQALALLKQQPWNFSTLPADQQSHPLIHEAAVQGWVVFVTKQPHFLGQVPESLCTHPKLQTTLSSLREAEKKALAKQVLEEVKKRPGLSDEAMSQLHLPAKDKQMWKQVTALRLKHWKKQVKADARAWERMPQSLQQDEDILKLMREGIGPQVRQKPALWNQLPACYQNDPCLQRVHRFATRA